MERQATDRSPDFVSGSRLYLRPERQLFRWQVRNSVQAIELQ